VILGSSQPSGPRKSGQRPPATIGRPYVIENHIETLLNVSIDEQRPWFSILV